MNTRHGPQSTYDDQNTRAAARRRRGLRLALEADEAAREMRALGFSQVDIREELERIEGRMKTRPMSDQMVKFLGRAQAKPGGLEVWRSDVNTAYALQGRGLGRVVFIPESQAPALAAMFSQILREWLTPEQLAEAVRRNREEPKYQNDACASHDFCDANEAMLEAWDRVIGSNPFPADRETAPGFVDMWNEAWDIARAAGFALEVRK